ncbi:MAG: DUF4114 domain-containing protein [Planctomycetota bacterium]
MKLSPPHPARRRAPGGKDFAPQRLNPPQCIAIVRQGREEEAHVNKRIAKVRALVAWTVGAALVGLGGLGAQGCSGGGGGGGGGSTAPAPTVSAPAQGAFVGQVVDQNNAPVSNAVVSVDGVSTTTDASGRFALNSTPVVTAAATVGGRVTAAASANVPVGVVGPGVDSAEVSVTFADGQIPAISVFRPSIVAGLDIAKPCDGGDYVVPTACQNPFLAVEGYASLTTRERLRHDICLLIDRSGSTDQPVPFAVGDAATPDTVLGAEIEAARCFVDSLPPQSKIRLAVVAFSDQGRTQVVQGFTNAMPQVKNALTSILNDPTRGGSNFAEGIDAVRSAFATLDAGNSAALSDDAGGEVRVLPKRICLMLTDGIPTAPFASNLSQEREDRVAAIEAARRAAQDQIAIHGYALIRQNDPQGPLSTLPQVSAITGGEYTRIEDESQLQAALCSRSFTQVIEVKVRNQQIGGSEVTAKVAPDGFFSVEVPVTLLGQDRATNTLEVEVSPLLLSQRLVKTLTVELHKESVVGTNDFSQISLQPVSSAGVKTPSGDDPGNDLLRQFLVAQFPDALQVRGVESFSVAGPSGNQVSVQVDLVFEDAGFSSDFGYFVFDPMNPPTTVQQALQSAVTIFNTAGIGGGAQADGARRFTANFPAGTTVGFFVIPNDTLVRAKAGNAKNDPLFTLSSLNPGNLGQVLNFTSANGRVGASPANPNSLVFAFEDLAIGARKSSDRDFNDVVFTVSSQVRPRPTAIICR